MTTKLDHALHLADQGFFVFPLAPGKKAPPLIDDFPTRATRAVGQIADWWAKWPQANIGISTDRIQDKEALLVVDVDTKNGRDGYTTLLRHELEGRELPNTRSQTTPSGGRHFVFSVASPVRQGVGVLGPGVDTRSRGGYIVAAGSTCGGREYTTDDDTTPVAPAPEWLVELCGGFNHTVDDRRDDQLPGTIAPDRARERVIAYLLSANAPTAIEGAGGDATTYRVAVECRDLGASEDDCAELMATHWNERCSPPWPYRELERKVRHAYRYAKNPAGLKAPEAVFQPIPASEQPAGEPVKTPPTPITLEELNKTYAYTIVESKGFVLREDENRGFSLLTKDAFHDLFASYKVMDTQRERKVSISRVWWEWKGRRTFQGLVFKPQQVTTNEYNLWRGFSVEPADSADIHHPALAALLEHIEQNICKGDSDLARWIIGWFAHLVQRPYEKPRVAVVLRGQRGTGKNVLIETMGELVRAHYKLVSDARYITGNFNSHLENCLLIALDEAFWSGDKKAEGNLKNLITGEYHLIERKGIEPYPVANLTRVVIIGNEEWLVPAAEDERRFAVFNVGEGRQNDSAFFHTIRDGMRNQGGYAHLLRFLLSVDLNAVDINTAPVTEGLYHQKVRTLDPFDQWWHESLDEGAIVCSDAEGWPSSMETYRLYNAYIHYCKERNVTSRRRSNNSAGRHLRRLCRSIVVHRKSLNVEGRQPNEYVLPPLSMARSEWANYLRVPAESIEWKTPPE